MDLRPKASTPDPSSVLRKDSFEQGASSGAAAVYESSGAAILMKLYGTPKEVADVSRVIPGSVAPQVLKDTQIDVFVMFKVIA